jgi:hypothetical protein
LFFGVEVTFFQRNRLLSEPEGLKMKVKSGIQPIFQKQLDRLCTGKPKKVLENPRGIVR